MRHGNCNGINKKVPWSNTQNPFSKTSITSPSANDVTDSPLASETASLFADPPPALAQIALKRYQRPSRKKNMMHGERNKNCNRFAVGVGNSSLIAGSPVASASEKYRKINVVRRGKTNVEISRGNNQEE
jgi:hypothetical protein